MHRRFYSAAVLVLTLVILLPTAESFAAGEEINWDCLPGGGGRSTTDGLVLVSAVGETAVGLSTAAAQQCRHGFLQNFNGENCCVGLTGNVDGGPGDFADIGDLSALIDYLFITLAEPACMAEANIDGSVDAVVDIGDLTALIDYLFITFATPAPCL